MGEDEGKVGERLKKAYGVMYPPALRNFGLLLRRNEEVQGLLY